MKVGRQRLAELGLYGAGPMAALLTTPLVARALGPESRGLVGVAMSACAIALSAGNWGLAEVYLAHRRSGTEGLERTVQRTIVISSSAASLVALLAAISMGVPWTIALSASIWLPGIALAGVWRSASVARRNTRGPAQANAIAAGTRLVAFPGLAITESLTAPLFAAVSQSAVVAGALATTFRGFRRDLLRARGAASTAQVSAPRLLCEGTPIVAFNGLTSVTLNSGAILSSALASPEAAGVFAATFGLSQAALAVSASFKARVQAALFEEDAANSVGSELKHMLALGTGGAIVAIALAYPATHLLLGPEFVGAAPVLQVLAVGAVAQMALDSAHGLLVVLGKRRQLIATAATGAVVAVTLMTLLVPHLGALGAAIGVSTAMSAGAVVGMLAAFRGLRETGDA